MWDGFPFRLFLFTKIRKIAGINKNLEGFYLLSTCGAECPERSPLLQRMACRSARALHSVLGDTQWRNFIPAVEKAKSACESMGESTVDHFAGGRKMVSIGSGSEREADDCLPTRYVCCPIAQNGDLRRSLSRKTISPCRLAVRNWCKRDFPTTNECCPAQNWPKPRSISREFCTNGRVRDSRGFAQTQTRRSGAIRPYRTVSKKNDKFSSRRRKPAILHACFP